MVGAIRFASRKIQTGRGKMERHFSSGYKYRVIFLELPVLPELGSHWTALAILRPMENMAQESQRVPMPQLA